MGSRREARERAVQFLFQYDLNPAEELDSALKQFWHAQALEDELSAVGTDAPTVREAATRTFAESLVRGTLQHRAELDEQIIKYAKNWDIHRMAVVDRNILRLAMYEMLHCEDIPPVVSINEAVDIAKKFSTEDSGKFVNGILDKVKGELMRASR